jgi:hypothetical protein
MDGMDHGAKAFSRNILVLVSSLSDKSLTAWRFSFEVVRKMVTKFYFGPRRRRGDS